MKYIVDFHKYIHKCFLHVDQDKTLVIQNWIQTKNIHSICLHQWT